MKRLFPIFLFVLGSFQIHGQILNVEQQRIITDTTGWAGRIGLSIAASKFTKSLFSFNAGSHLQYKDSKNLYLFIVNYDIVNAGGERFDNRGHAHFRYNYKINALVRWEFFTQVQFNSLTKIRLRSLTGTGPRFKLSNYEKAKFYWGIAYMFEYEELVDPIVFHNDHRISSYFTFTLIPEKTIRFSNTTYAQPLINNFNDFRIANDSNLVFDINKNLKFTTVFSFLYDSNPPIDIPNTNYVIRNGLQYKFK